MKITVTEEAVRQYIREAYGSKIDWQALTNPLPAQVSDVVDPSAALTDPSNDNFTPTNRVELKTTLSTMIDDVSDDDAPDFYAAMQDYIDDKKEKEEENDMKRSDVSRVEETIRRRVRMIILEALPKFTRPESSPLARAVTDPDPALDRKGLISHFKGHGYPLVADAMQQADAVMKLRDKLNPPKNIRNIKPTIGTPEKSVEPKGMISSRESGMSYSGTGPGGSFDVDAATKAALEGLKEFDFEEIKKKPESFLKLMVKKLMNVPGDRKSNVEAAIDAVALRSIDAADALRGALDADPSLIPGKNVTVSDVGGASLPDIAKAIGQKSHGRIQDFIDRGLTKAQFMLRLSNPELKILLLTVLDSYVQELQELSKEGDLEGVEDLSRRMVARIESKDPLGCFDELKSFRNYFNNFLEEKVKSLGKSLKDLTVDDLVGT